jgi:hypothetical protein
MVSEKSGREAKLCSEPEERWREDHDVETCTDKTHYGASLSTPLVRPHMPHSHVNTPAHIVAIAAVCAEWTVAGARRKQ